MTPIDRRRGIFCNRTLNLRAIKAVGYDMDYTLVHYRIEEWERRAYEYVKEKLAPRGWPLDDLRFDPEMVMRGLIIDVELGNLIKANRFGYVIRAAHGSRLIPFEEQRAIYARTLVDLEQPRWVFLNTLFSLSEACLYAQLVDLLDSGGIGGAMGYADLYRVVRASIDEAHMEGELKSEIVGDPERFVELDEEAPLTLLDQVKAGKRLLLITNSEWPYARAMMSYAFDRLLPGGMTWRDLFELVIVSARKPQFFSATGPVFQVKEDGTLRPAPRGIVKGGVYLAGHAGMVEQYLGLSGDEILYVGDHIYTDVHASKDLLRWRTALVLRELEDELDAIEGFVEHQTKLTGLMHEKEDLERQYCQVRLEIQRKRGRYGPRSGRSVAELERKLAGYKRRIEAMDEKITPLAVAANELHNQRWGLLMRAGNDKSHLARQVERSADIYTSRVSNFLHETPFAYLRAPRGSLPHD